VLIFATVLDIGFLEVYGLISGVTM